jgi:hypothetical protein
MQTLDSKFCKAPVFKALKTVFLIANGHLRTLAERWNVKRAHSFSPAKQHGFIDSQKYGIEVFRNIPSDAPLAPDKESARHGVFAKASATDSLGLKVSFCGDV